MKNNSSSSDSSNPSLNAIRNEDWKSLISSINRLFKDRTLQYLDLDVLNEKVRNVKDFGLVSDLFTESYKDSILKTGMIVLRSELKEKDKKSGNFFGSLAEIWIDFYCSILPYLQAIFYPIQASTKMNFASINLIGFRDLVLLKSKITDVLQPGQKVSNHIKQMLLIVCSVRDFDKAGSPTPNFMRMEELTSRVIQPFIGFNGLRKLNENLTTKNKAYDVNHTKERKVSRSQLIRVEIKKLNCTGGSISPDEKELNNNRNKEFADRIRSGNSPRNENNKDSSVKSSSDDPASGSADDDMMDYWEMRQQRWQNKEETLYTESLS